MRTSNGVNHDDRVITLADRLMQAHARKSFGREGKAGLFEEFASGGFGEAFAQPDLAAREAQTTGQSALRPALHQEDLDPE